MDEEKTFTQEEVNAIVEKRLKKYSDYDELKTKVGGYEQQLSELTEAHEKEIAELNAAHESQITGLNTRIADYEINSVKMRVAMEAGLPAELADRLQGTDEESFRADAQKLINYTKPQAAPPYNPEPPVETDAQKASLQKMLSQLKI